jgi:hypothetical protein
MRLFLLLLGFLLCVLGAGVVVVGMLLAELGISFVPIPVPLWQLGAGVVVLGVLAIVWSRVIKGAAAARSP